MRLRLPPALSPRRKYGNKIVAHDYNIFASKAERSHYLVLWARQNVGEITHLEIHKSYVLLEGFDDRNGKWHRAITYVSDFAYVEEGVCVVEDTKGCKTQVFRIKEKLFRHRYPDIDFRIVGV